MKVGNKYGFKGREFSIMLVLLIFTAILLWTWEKNPLITTLQSAKERFMMSFPGNFVQAPSSPSQPMKAKEQNKVKQSSSFGSEMEKIMQAENSTPEKSSAVAATTAPKVKDHQNGTNSTQKNVCNYAKGRWVSDSRRPLYSGSECKQWLSGMWSCRLNHRIDFSFEGYRWQPENCEVPNFNRSEFLKRMQDKTIAFVGDSLGRQQFQSLMCMVTGGEDSPEIENVGWAYGLVKARGAIRPDGWAYRFPRTNTTILYYWSASLSDLQPLNVSDPITDVAMHLDRPPTFLSRYLQNFDVLVLNTGHHWNRGKIKGNRWVMHVNAKPVEEDDQLSDIGNAKNFTVHSIARWVHSQLALHPRLTAFFRTISPRHFLNGDWNTGGSCDNTIPLLSGSEVLQEGSSDPIIEAAIKGTKVKLLDITAISHLRDEGHISRYSIRPVEGMQDCLHWCLPGIPDTWNEILCAQV